MAYENFEKLRNYVNENFASEKMTPAIRDELFSNHSDFIYGLGKGRGPTRSAINMVSFMRKHPTPNQKALLKAMYSLGDSSDSINSYDLCNATGCKDMGDFVPMYLLNYMEIAEVKHVRYCYDIIKPDATMIEKYWPEIEKWESKATEREYANKINAIKGQRIREVLEILGKKSVDELTENEIRNLSRIDWKLKGLNIPQSTLPELKGLLLKKIKA